MQAHCAFCFVALDPDAPGALWISVGSERDEGTQSFYVHSSCLAKCIHPDVPFEPSVFEPDDLEDDLED